MKEKETIIEFEFQIHTWKLYKITIKLYSLISSKKIISCSHFINMEYIFHYKKIINEIYQELLFFFPRFKIKKVKI